MPKVMMLGDASPAPPPPSWTGDAAAALQANPTYFVWWYTLKSVGLVVAVAVAAFYIGRASRRRR